MPFSTTSTLIERKSYLINFLFIRSADQDYLNARWAYSNGMFQNFYWAAAQSFEKYARAFLLYNEQSAIIGNHKLRILYQKLEAVRPSLSNLQIEVPSTTAMGQENWIGKNLAYFVDVLDTFGSSDSRYALEDVVIDGPIIHWLDGLTASLRGAIRSQNFLADDTLQLSKKDVHPFDYIAPDLPWMINYNLPLERLYMNQYEVGQSEELRFVFRNMNFAFFEERTVSEQTFGGFVAVGSQLRNQLLRWRKIDKSQENRMIIDDLSKWVMENIRISRKLKSEVEKVLPPRSS